MSELLNQAIKQTLDLYKRRVGEGDLTVETLWPYPRHTEADIYTTKKVPVFVLPVLEAVMRQGDPTLLMETKYQDEAVAQPGELAIHIEGNGRAILTGWQVAQPILSLLASVYEKICDVVEELKPAKIDVTHNIDLPVGYDKIIGYAVEEAGGQSFAAGLNEMVYLSSDHVSWTGSLQEAIRRTIEEVGDNRSLIKVIVEAKEPNDVAQLQDAKVDWVYCKDFTADEVRQAGELSKGWTRLIVDDTFPLDVVKTLRESGVRLFAVNVNTLFASAKLLSIQFDIESAQAEVSN